MDRKQAAARLGGTRPPVDLCAELVIGDGRRCLDGVLRPGETLVGDTAWSNEETILRVGGRWDPNTRTWSSSEPETAVRYRMHRGQEPAARKFAAWLPRYVSQNFAGEPLAPGGRLFDIFLRGGRRGGKTHVAIVFVILFCLAKRDRIVHALSAIADTSVELQSGLAALIPPEWYGGKPRQRKNRPVEFAFVNGSVIRLLSGKSYRKQGRVDLGFLNEMQDGFPRETYDKIRAPIADTGGLIVGAFNPADDVESIWVDEIFHASQDGKITGAVGYQLAPRDNPLITHEALEAMRSSMDARAARRELDGEDVPVGDAVMHEWTESDHWIDPPPGWPDITAAFLAARGAPPAGAFVGMDFQRSPYMAARIYRVHRAPDGRECPWIVGEADVEGDEEALHLELVAKGADPATWPAVIDASAWWQDGAHTEGRTSDRVLRRLGWKHLLRPQVKSDRNPEIKIRMRNANRLLRSGTKVVLLHVARACVRTAEAFKKYPRIKGVPSRHSDFAHGVDAATYPLFRFFPPPSIVEVGALHRGVRGVSPRAAALAAREGATMNGRDLDRIDDAAARARTGRSPSGRDAGW